MHSKTREDPHLKERISAYLMSSKVRKYKSFKWAL